MSKGIGISNETTQFSETNPISPTRHGTPNVRIPIRHGGACLRSGERRWFWHVSRWCSVAGPGDTAATGVQAALGWYAASTALCYAACFEVRVHDFNYYGRRNLHNFNQKTSITEHGLCSPKSRHSDRFGVFRIQLAPATLIRSSVHLYYYKLNIYDCQSYGWLTKP